MTGPKLACERQTYDSRADNDKIESLFIHKTETTGVGKQFPIRNR